MTVGEIFDNIEVQSEVCIVKFDDDKNERVELERASVLEKEIRFMYCENDILYIEVESES